MEIIKRIFKWIVELCRHVCPNCGTELACDGSHPWGRFTYSCEKCGYKE